MDYYNLPIDLEEFQHFTCTHNIKILPLIKIQMNILKDGNIRCSKNGSNNAIKIPLFSFFYGSDIGFQL